MSSNELELKTIMSNVFEIPLTDINNESSPDNLEQWDSLKHMELVIEVENYFHVDFPEEAIIESLNFELLLFWVNKLKNDLIS
jgi:acyl carrier protein